MHMIFCNIGWMNEYKGDHEGDQLKNGGSYNKSDTGAETCNFLAIGEEVYGYVRASGASIVKALSNDVNADQVDNVLVIWTATPEGGGSSVVGWYRNATIHGDMQKIPKPTEKHRLNHVTQFLISAKKEDVFLLPPEERPKIIPRGKEGGFGTSQVWYAKSKLGESTKIKVVNLMKRYGFDVQIKIGWTDEELFESVKKYQDMLLAQRNGQKINKTQVYRDFSEKYGRSEKACELRMQNISAVYAFLGREYVSGLKPARNVGSQIQAKILSYIEEIEKQKFIFDESQSGSQKPPTKKPKGNPNPGSSNKEITVYERDRAVVDWVLNLANGICECCGQDAPFTTLNEKPFLEVHHIVRLADKGQDTPENAVAICPNCHRHLHYGKDRAELVEKLYRKIPRLKKFRSPT